MNRRSALIWLLVAVLWTGVIFLLSTRSWADSDGTSRSLASVLSGLLIPDFSSWAPSRQAEWLSGIDRLLRKVAHVFEFGLLGILGYRVAANLSGRFRRWRPPTKFSLGTIVFYPCAVIAAMDELIQKSAAGRTSSPTDLLLDWAGVILGIIICAHWTKLPGSPTSGKPGVRRRG